MLQELSPEVGSQIQEVDIMDIQETWRIILRFFETILFQSFRIVSDLHQRYMKLIYHYDLKQFIPFPKSLYQAAVMACTYLLVYNFPKK